MKAKNIIIVIFVVLVGLLVVFTFNNLKVKNSTNTGAVADATSQKEIQETESVMADAIKQGGVIGSHFNPETKQIELTSVQDENGVTKISPLVITADEILQYGQEIQNQIDMLTNSGRTHLDGTTPTGSNEYMLGCGIRHGNTITIFHFTYTAHNVWWCHSRRTVGGDANCDYVYYFE